MARYQRQVFESIQPASQGPVDKWIPLHACLGPHYRGARALFQDPGAGTGKVHDRTFEALADEQDVAALAEHQQRQLPQLRRQHQCGQGCRIVNRGHVSRGHVDVKRIALLQANVVRDGVRSAHGPGVTEPDASVHHRRAIVRQERGADRVVSMQTSNARIRS